MESDASHNEKPNIPQEVPIRNPLRLVRSLRKLLHESQDHARHLNNQNQKLQRVLHESQRNSKGNESGSLIFLNEKLKAEKQSLVCRNVILADRNQVLINQVEVLKNG